jgi:hypothetical protein
MLTNPALSLPVCTKPAVIELREQLAKKWPDAISRVASGRRSVLKSGIAPFDDLFPCGGLPVGQLIEVTGSESSGKTSFLLRLLSGLTRLGKVAYIECSGGFFPVAARYAGVDLQKLVIVTASQSDTCVRAAEQLLYGRTCIGVVFDLSGYRQSLSLTQVHRLRLKVSRARGLIIFLTQDNSQVVPASMTSLRLLSQREVDDTVQLTVIRSRICPEGVSVRVAL